MAAPRMRIRIWQIKDVEDVPESYIKTSYSPAFPFPEGMQCFTKGPAGMVEILLDREAKQFCYSDIRATNPTALLTKMSLDYDVMPLSCARSNWSFVWFRIGDGPYVLGKTLRWAHARACERDLVECTRLDVPAE